MLDAIAHGILQAMATLHERSLPMRSLPLPPPKGSLSLPPPKGGGVELESRWFLDTVEGGCRMVGDVIKIGIVVVRNGIRDGITGTGCLI